MPDWFFWILVFYFGMMALFAVIAVLNWNTPDGQQIWGVVIQMAIAAGGIGIVALVSVYGGPILSIFTDAGLTWIKALF